MNSQIKELHSIMPIQNLASVIQHGILSHNEIKIRKVQHVSIAREDIQDERHKKNVTGGGPLHDYANLYFNARNPMLYKRLSKAEEICILRVSTSVLDVDGVVLTDQNATSPWVRFLDKSQLGLINFNMVYSDNWTHQGNAPLYFRHRSVMCAEVLVPKCIPSCLIFGAYVINSRVSGSLSTIMSSNPNFEIKIQPKLFFN